MTQQSSEPHHHHEEEEESTHEFILIAGCGFLGTALADLLHATGSLVVALTRSPESAHTLALTRPYPVYACDIAQRDQLATTLAPALREVSFTRVIHCASSNRGDIEAYRKVYLDGTRSLIDVLAPKILVFTSSTSVYAQTSGEIVTEESPANPSTPTGIVLRETEDLTLAREGRVARLSGLYGPGRSVILRRFLDGSATMDPGGTRIINQIHRDDAATALAILCRPQTPAGIYNVTDHHPFPQAELYAALAQHFSRPLPPEQAPDPNRKRGLTSKSVSNRKLQALGWTPQYPDFLDAIRDDHA